MQNKETVRLTLFIAIDRSYLLLDFHLLPT